MAKYFDTTDNTTRGYAVAIWNKTNGDMLAHRISPSRVEALHLAISLMRSLSTDRAFIDSVLFEGDDLALEITEFVA